MAEHEQIGLALDVGEVELRGPADSVERDLPYRLELVAQAADLRLRGRLVEAADADVDRMDRATADDFEDLVAELLHPQALLDDLAVVGRHLDRARVAEEVRGVQHVDMQRVALDPLSAVEQPAQVANRPLVDRDPARVLHRTDRAGLVGDRADAANPRGDVGRLGEGTPAQQGLEEARRLIDPQLDVDDLGAVDLHIHRTLALDAREVVGADRARALGFAHSSLASLNAGAAALNVR